MPTVDDLTKRLNAIAHRLERSGSAHALLGLGSCGSETARMDEFSDLDFFAIVHEGRKAEFLHNLDWLTDIAPKGYAFQNTRDGYKFLFQDGIFCEFAVFEPRELAGIPFAPGRVIWAEDGFDVSQLEPSTMQGHYQRSDDAQWILGEALTNLYVGLGRCCRGEKLSAFKFVQSFALDRLVDLFHLQKPERTGYVDAYMPDRRLEVHFPESERLLRLFCQGYAKTPESALAQLDWLEVGYDVSPVMAAEIRRLAKLATIG